MEKQINEIEALLRGQAYSNPDHKEKLRKRLADMRSALSEDELGLVAGGVRSEEETDGKERPGVPAAPRPV